MSYAIEMYASINLCTFKIGDIWALHVGRALRVNAASCDAIHVAGCMLIMVCVIAAESLTLVLVQIDAHLCRHAHTVMNECCLGMEVYDRVQVERDAYQGAR
eukprot:3216314-Pleurochrysis_carterae.AAC.1